MKENGFGKELRENEKNPCELEEKYFPKVIRLFLIGLIYPKMIYISNDIIHKYTL